MELYNRGDGKNIYIPGQYISYNCNQAKSYRVKRSTKESVAKKKKNTIESRISEEGSTPPQ